MSALPSTLEWQSVDRARQRAADLVSRFYVLAPREWERMPFEVRTRSELSAGEVLDDAYAQVLCYGVERRVRGRLVEQIDLYRICLQDRVILDRARNANVEQLTAVLLYVLTHELVHVVRFGQRMQAMDLPAPLRRTEELSVDRTARLILRDVDEPGLADALVRFTPTFGA